MNAKSIGVWMERKLAAALARAARAAGCSRAESVRRCCVLFLSQGAMRPGSAGTKRRRARGEGSEAGPAGAQDGGGSAETGVFLFQGAIHHAAAPAAKPKQGARCSHGPAGHGEAGRPCRAATGRGVAPAGAKTVNRGRGSSARKK